MKEYGHTRNDTEYMVDKFGNRIIGGKHLLASVIRGDSSFRDLIADFYGIDRMGDNGPLYNPLEDRLNWTGIKDGEPEKIGKSPEKLLRVIGGIGGNLAFSKPSKETDSLKYEMVREAYSRNLDPKILRSKKLLKGVGITAGVSGILAFGGLLASVGNGSNLPAMLYGAGVGGLASLGIGLLLIPKPTPKGLESFVSLNKMARDIDEIISGVPLGYFNQDLFRDNFLEFLPE